MYETLITHYKSPLYFSQDMAKDAGVSWEKFYKTWHETDGERTLGKLSFEKVIRTILEENGVFSEERLSKIINKRRETKKALFKTIHKEIIPLLEKLKEKNIKIALISNCFDEEAEVIEKSVLAPYFDVICLSSRLGLKKPDPAIFEKCLQELKLDGKDCIYCGDGGSQELETARSSGMKSLQACWYFSEENKDILLRKPDFPQLESPLELLDYLF